MNANVILSTALILEPGRFEMNPISIGEAREFAQTAVNFVGHSTVRVLGIEPATTRETCAGYDQALVVKLNGRPDPREYTIEEIERVGYELYLIRKIPAERQIVQHIIRANFDYGPDGDGSQ